MALIACLVPNRTLMMGIAVSAVAASSFALHARSEERIVTCANDASGATWQIKIDYDRSTVDSHPARISDATISWQDATSGGNYTLDRKSGKLTVVVPSSTGGYFLYHHCRPGN